MEGNDAALAGHPHGVLVLARGGRLRRGRHLAVYSPEGERGPRKARRERAAKEICARCKVAEVCAAFALATREPYGTWGGLSEGDRRKLWRRTDQRTAQLGYRRALADWERRTVPRSVS